MKSLFKSLLLSTSYLLLSSDVMASEAIIIKPTQNAALLDGRCGNDEWDVATQIELPKQVLLYLMHDRDSFYFCAKGLAKDSMGLDLYVEHPKTGYLHHFHVSAQMGERIRTEKGWSQSATWQLKDYAGFWTPYFGYEQTDNGRRPKFFRGSHRQMHILRRKFPAQSWKMMFGVGVNRNGKWKEYLYPEGADGEDKTTWATFEFSK